MIQRLLAALLLPIASVLPAPARADTLVDHVNGLSLSESGQVEHFNGLVIGNDGRITAVLHGGDKRPRADFAVDGQGRTLLPGLILPAFPLMPAALAAITPSGVTGPLPPPRPEDRDLALATIQPQLFAHGITTVTDMGTSIEDWQTYRRAGDEGRLALRVLAYAGGTPAMALIAGPRPTPWLYDDRLRLGGTYLEAPARPGPAGEVQLKNQMSRAAMDHFQPAVHAMPETEPAVRAAFAELSETYRGDRRWRVETAPLAVALPDVLAEMAGSLDRLGVLRRYTIDAARNAFAEGRLGRIAIGGRADFFLIDADPQLAGAGELRGAHVLATWIGGRKVWAVAATTPAPSGKETSEGR